MKKSTSPSYPIPLPVGCRRFRMDAGLLALLVVAACLGLGACAAVGPDYVPPPDDSPMTWHTALQDGLIEAPPDPLTLSRWWATLDDPDLSRFVERAAAGNRDLGEAQARVREARARRGISKAGLFPTVDASAAVTRSRSSENSGSGETGNFY
ncbi:MAG TPA: TolC family protein, partial [Desulfobacterales bacterium]|nr:TolC family protein [Desulfobacterales bacterium]